MVLQAIATVRIQLRFYCMTTDNWFHYLTCGLTCISLLCCKFNAADFDIRNRGFVTLENKLYEFCQVLVIIIIILVVALEFLQTIQCVRNEVQWCKGACIALHIANRATREVRGHMWFSSFKPGGNCLWFPLDEAGWVTGWVWTWWQSDKCLLLLGINLSSITGLILM